MREGPEPAKVQIPGIGFLRELFLPDSGREAVQIVLSLAPAYDLPSAGG